MDKCFCLKCKCKQDIKDIEIKTTKNNRQYQQGKCVKCDCLCNRFLKCDKKGVKEQINQLLKEDSP